MNQERVTVGVTHTGNTMDAGGPVTTIVTWEIQEGREKQFETWRHEIEAAATKFPGHLGVNLIVPNNGSREYTVVFRFDTYEPSACLARIRYSSRFVKKGRTISSH
ncbi:hypothetical protein BAT02nite_21710 [Bacillus atrophaeus]|nr:hypothetical protein BAT02nite_21710 [Bacillus atrophaeus]